MDPILLDLPVRFETERLYIARYEDGDGRAFLNLIQSNLNHLQEELSETHLIKIIEDAETYVRHKKVDWISRVRLVPKIIQKKTGRMLGQLWVEPRWDRMIFEIGYFVEEASQGMGYITEAVKEMNEFMFRELGANKIEIKTKATNLKSIGVAERCGFTKEAHLRDQGRTNEGEVVDMLSFGFLKRDYESMIADEK